MKAIHIGKARTTLSKIPKPPIYLTDNAKKHFKEMADILIRGERLKEIHLKALEVYSEAMSQFEFANREIKYKNNENFGSGYIQTYKTGATNISTEIVLRNDAVKTLFKCFKQFGLDPKSEKELKPQNTNQRSLFEDLKKELSKSS